MSPRVEINLEIILTDGEWLLSDPGNEDFARLGNTTAEIPQNAPYIAQLIQRAIVRAASHIQDSLKESP